MVALNPINNNAADFRDLQIGTSTRHFYYTNHWQRIEERHELDNTLSLHAHWLPGARYIDDHVLRDVVSTPGDVNIDADQRKYYLSDANWNTVAIVGKTSIGPDVWGVQERYAYQPYGTPLYLESDFSTKSTQESAYTVEELFQGFVRIPYVFTVSGRYRLLSASLGIWISRDPILPNLIVAKPSGFSWRSFASGGFESKEHSPSASLTEQISEPPQSIIPYELFDSNPVRYTDPYGLCVCPQPVFPFPPPNAPASRCRSISHIGRQWYHRERVACQAPPASIPFPGFQTCRNAACSLLSCEYEVVYVCSNSLIFPGWAAAWSINTSTIRQIRGWC